MNKFSKIKKIIIFLTIFFAIFFFAKCSLANITFTNGYWSENFDGWADWQDSAAMPVWGNVAMDYRGRGQAANCPDGNFYSSVNSTPGRSGKGFRNWLGCSWNNQSVNPDLTFTTRQNEFWIRMSVRMGPSAYVNPSGAYIKLFYADYDASHRWGIDIITGGITLLGQAVLCPVAPLNGCAPPVTGYYQWGPGGWLGTFSDLQWHTVEWYVNNSSGFMKLWLDGVIIADVTGVYTGSPMSGCEILMNQSINQGGTNNWFIDLDDIFVANSSYTGFVLDSNGNPMIGMVGSTPTPDTTPPAAPTGVIII